MSHSTLRKTLQTSTQENPFLEKPVKELLSNFITSLEEFKKQNPWIWWEILWRIWRTQWEKLDGVNKLAQLFEALNHNGIHMLLTRWYENLLETYSENEVLYWDISIDSLADLEINAALEIAKQVQLSRYWDVQTTQKVENLIDSDVSWRIEALSGFTWIDESKKKEIIINKKHIQVAWKIFQLNDIWTPHAAQLSSIGAFGDIRAKYILPWEQDIYDVLAEIWWTQDQQADFFRDVFKMREQWSRNSSIEHYWLRPDSWITTSYWPLLFLENIMNSNSDNRHIWISRQAHKWLQKPARLMKQFT